MLRDTEAYYRLLNTSRNNYKPKAYWRQHSNKFRSDHDTDLYLPALFILVLDYLVTVTALNFAFSNIRVL